MKYFIFLFVADKRAEYNLIHFDVMTDPVLQIRRWSCHPLSC
jgi:hypothetical protein